MRELERQQKEVWSKLWGRGVFWSSSFLSVIQILEQSVNLYFVETKLLLLLIVCVELMLITE